MHTSHAHWPCVGRDVNYAICAEVGPSALPRPHHMSAYVSSSPISDGAAGIFCLSKARSLMPSFNKTARPSLVSTKA